MYGHVCSSGLVQTILPHGDVKRNEKMSFECDNAETVSVVMKGTEGSVWNLRRGLK